MSLTIRNLSVVLDGKNILKGIHLEIKPGKVYALMGPNGSGKSTLAQVLMGNPSYGIMGEGGGKPLVILDKKDITYAKPNERAALGLYLAFQNPLTIPGVSVSNLLKTAYQAIHGLKSIKEQSSKYNPSLSVWDFNKILVEKAKKLGLAQEFLRRSLNDGFSGGEKKKMEMLQAQVLRPKYAIFDEIDTGLDVDALKIVATGIQELKKQGTGIVIITHYTRILHFAKPDFVHILIKGELVLSGRYALAQKIEKSGYKNWIRKNVQ